MVPKKSAMPPACWEAADDLKFCSCSVNISA